jgi:tetratricopeptide (TPR) repeat protein
MKSYKDAIAAYDLALKAGYEAPALLHNNIGYNYLKLGRFDDAEQCFLRAIQLDGNLQAPHYNMVMVSLRRVLCQQPIRKAAFLHAARAIEIGPCTAGLYRGIADFYAAASTQDTTLVPATIEYVGKAVEYGVTPDAFSNPAYSALRQEATFLSALKRPAVTSSASEVVQLLDPLAKR